MNAADAEAADAYFVGFVPDPEGPLLPESTRANRLIGGCLESFGIAVSYAGAGGIFRRHNPAQQARGEALIQVCMEAMARRGLVSLNESDPRVIRRRYEAYLKAFHCLTRQGIEVEAPPSLKAYLDGQTWSPFNGVLTIVNSEKGLLEGPAVVCAVP